MNILTLGCCPKAEKFLSVFGRHLKQEEGFALVQREASFPFQEGKLLQF
jgi:hypothetical protein